MSNGKQGGLIDSAVVADWQGKANRALADNKIHSKTTGKSWTNGFFSCFSPPDLCLLTCCLPCVTFGKTYHRLEHNGDMSTYEPINTSCILFYLSSCIGAHCLVTAVQNMHIRERFNLEGNCIEDILKACCCGCCALVQAEKETRALLPGEKHVVTEQYQGGAGEQGMVMPGKQM